MSIESINEYQKSLFGDPSQLVSLTHSKGFSEDEKMKIASSQFEKIMIRKQLEVASEPIVKNDNSPFNLNKGYAGMFYNDLLANSFTSSSIFNLEKFFTEFNQPS